MKVPRESSEFERKSMRDVERSSTRQSAQSITKEYFMLKSDSQRSLRQSRNSRVSVTEDTKGRNTRQSNNSMNSRVSIVESGEKLPHSTPSQTPEKAPTPPWEPEQPTTPSLIPPPAPPPTPSTISETSKSGSSQEWKSSKSSQEWNSSKSSQEWNSSKSSQEWKSSKFSLTQSPKDTSEDTDEDVSNWTPGRPRPPKPKNAITIAVSSRALFNMVEDNKIFENEGLEKYVEHQIANENVILRPGPAFGFIKALQNVNARLRSLYPKEQDLFDIVLMTNNHAQVGVRLINSINHHGLLIDRFCLTGGESPIGYLKSYLTNLYLSADCDKVQEAIEEGIAAATMYLGNKDLPFSETQLRVAFDGDALLFSDDFDPHVKVKEKEKPKAAPQEPFSKDKPLAQGPLKQFLEDLGRLQKKFYAKDERLLCPIRTYLITARSAASSGARVLKTLRAWGLEIDEALFLAGAPKGPILVKIRPHIFFDDDMFHIKELQKFNTIVASVPFSSPRRGSLSQEVENK